MARAYDHTCAHCGIRFTNRKAAGKFCSKQCFAQSKTIRTEKTCIQCGAKVGRTPSQLKNSKNIFCGHSCRNEWMRSGNIKRERVSVACNHCGASLSVLPSRAKRFKKYFCGQGCYISWKKHSEPKGADSPLYAERKEVPCANCGATLLRTETQIGRYARQFCCKRCVSAWCKEHLVGEAAHNFIERIPCDRCGNFASRPSLTIQEYGKVFCGKICRRKWRADNLRGNNWITYQGKRTTFVSCSQCGAQTEKRARDVDVPGRKFYCSKACWRAGHARAMGGANHSRWKGGISSFRGPNWVKQSKAARKRDNYICQCCGKRHRKGQRHFPVHHIRPFREFGYIPDENENYKQANRLSNLITLCVPCHFKAEFGQIALQPKLL